MLACLAAIFMTLCSDARNGRHEITSGGGGGGSVVTLRVFPCELRVRGAGVGRVLV